RAGDLALLHGAVRGRLLDRHDHGVSERGVALVGAPHHPDALHLLGAGVVGDFEHRARLDHRSARRRVHGGDALGLVAPGHDRPDPPALLLGQRPGLLDDHAVTDPALVVLVVRLEVLRHPDHALVARMAIHAVDLYHPRLLHGVTDPAAFPGLAFPHGLYPFFRSPVLAGSARSCSIVCARARSRRAWPSRDGFLATPIESWKRRLNTSSVNSRTRCRI